MTGLENPTNRQARDGFSYKVVDERNALHVQSRRREILRSALNGMSCNNCWRNVSVTRLPHCDAQETQLKVRRTFLSAHVMVLLSKCG